MVISTFAFSQRSVVKTELSSVLDVLLEMPQRKFVGHFKFRQLRESVFRKTFY